MRTQRARTSREYDTKLLLESKTENDTSVSWAAVTHFMGRIEARSGKSITAGNQEKETTLYDIYVPWRDGTFSTPQHWRLKDTATDQYFYVDDVIDLKLHHREYRIICRTVN